MQEILNEMRGHGNDNQFKPMQKFLQKWIDGSMSREDKDRYFSGYTSHELHLFLKKHDPAYFEEVVQPFIRNKLEKTFVDYYLLEELEIVCQYASADKFDNHLNALEKSLLIDALTRAGQNEKAKQLTALIQL